MKKPDRPKIETAPPSARQESELAAASAGARGRRVLLVDDHPIMRHGLAQLIVAEEDLEVCAQAGTAAEAVRAVESSRPDLVLTDLSLPDKHGLEFIKDMRTMHPGVLLLVLSMHDESLYAERALRAGARGYLMKETAADHLIKALRRVLGGGIYLSEKMADAVLLKVSGGGRTPDALSLDRLTDREMEVFQLIGAGKSSRRIAEMLHVSARTVDAHRAHIKGKLQLPDGNALVRHAVRWAEGRTDG